MRRIGTFHRFWNDQRGFLALGSILLDPDEPGAEGAGGDQEPVEPQIIDIPEGATFRVHGVDDPIKVSEFGDRFIPQARYTQQRQTETAELEQLRTQLAQREAQTRQYYQALTTLQQANKVTTTAETGETKLAAIMASVNAKGFVGPEDMQAAMALSSGGSGETSTAVQQIVQTLGMLWKNQQNMQNSISGITGGMADTSVAEMIAELQRDHEITEDQAHDIVHNWQPEPGESFKEMCHTVAGKYEANSRKFHSDLGATKLAAAKEKHRAGLTGKGGNASPTGKPKFDPDKTIEDIARELDQEGFFDESAQA